MSVYDVCLLLIDCVSSISSISGSLNPATYIASGEEETSAICVCLAQSLWMSRLVSSEIHNECSYDT